MFNITKSDIKPIIVRIPVPTVPTPQPIKPKPAPKEIQKS